MGWSYGEVNGKPVGYSVPDVCNHPECDVAIDRGLSYACGDMPGSGQGCDGFFCSKHMEWTGLDAPRQLCMACKKELRASVLVELPACDCGSLDCDPWGHEPGCPEYKPLLQPTDKSWDCFTDVVREIDQKIAEIILGKGAMGEP
jgi:hypothetical protein